MWGCERCPLLIGTPWDRLLCVIDRTNYIALSKQHTLLLLCFGVWGFEAPSYLALALPPLPTAMDHHSSNEHPARFAKRRKVRKGTHSCLDCRRRKVKCIYASPDSPRCVVCQKRGASCISQSDDASQYFTATDDSDTAGMASARTAAYDCDSVLAPSDESTRAPLSSLPTPTSTAASTTTELRSNRAGRQAPHLEMANTDLGTKLQEDSGYQQRLLSGERTLPGTPIFATLREELLRAFPSNRDLGLLSERVASIAALYYQTDYRSHGSGFDQPPPTSQSTVKPLLHPDKHPVLLAKQMLLFAAALQCLQSDEVVPGLTEHHHVIMKALAESAIQLVNMNDETVTSLEGLENLIFEIFYHVDSGNIQRAWVTARRAVTAAQMARLHRSSDHYLLLNLSDESNADPEVLWNTIVSMERLLSLLLGLPTSTGLTKLASQATTSEAALSQNLTTLVGNLAGKILERSGVNSAQEAQDMTKEIDKETILAAEQLPSDFWKPLAFAGIGKDTPEALSETRRAFAHMCYYSLVVQLHMSQMLSQDDAAQQVYSRTTCVNASREILNRELELRQFNPIAGCCRMSDFMALIAGMGLVLGHITTYGGDKRDHSLTHQRLSDRAIVERALDCISPLSDLNKDKLSSRCIALLRDLLAIEQDAARQHVDSGQTKASETNQHYQKARRNLSVMRLPYLGNIRISPDGVKVLTGGSRMEQAQSSLESVSIGGIGTIVPERRVVGTDSSIDNNDAAFLPDKPITTASQCDASMMVAATSDSNTLATMPMSGSNWMLPDMITPNFESWGFQGAGVDFMETSIHRSAVSPTKGFIDVQWDHLDTSGFVP